MNLDKILSAVLSEPTAPFSEQFVLETCQKILKAHKIPFFFDKAGNLIAGVKNKKELSEAKLLLLAHTDHPGIRVESRVSTTFKKSLYKARWWGGGPTDSLRGHWIILHDPVDRQTQVKGKVIKVSKKTDKLRTRELIVEVPADVKLSDSVFGTLNFTGYSKHKNVITSRAADDLVGVSIAIATLIQMKKKARKKTVAILTRAEEVGLVGCIHLLDSLKISNDAICVSLEASKFLPGAVPGSGPVIRLGDRATLFSNDACKFMSWCAEESKDLKFQKRVMDGGRCEASALVQYGYLTAGISIPLINYHNVGAKGPAPEQVHFSDVQSAVEICKKMANEINRFKALRKKWNNDLRPQYKKLAPYLKSWRVEL